MIFQRSPLSDESDGKQSGGETCYGNFSRNQGEKNTYRASSEPSEDIWVVFMANVKDFHVIPRGVSILSTIKAR